MMNNNFRVHKNENKDNWIRAKRILAVVVATALWVASMQFSFVGFSFNMSSMTWLGWILAVAVTIIELVFNTDIKKLNLTLFVAGLIAYGYGVITNIIGFYAAQGGTADRFYEHPESILFAVLVGAFLEIVPEPLFIWGLGVDEGGDFLANLVRGRKQMDEGRWTNMNVTQTYDRVMPNIEHPGTHNQRKNQPRPAQTQPYRPVINAGNKANTNKRREE